jgi:hypothetical protein
MNLSATRLVENVNGEPLERLTTRLRFKTIAAKRGQGPPRCCGHSSDGSDLTGEVRTHNRGATDTFALCSIPPKP